MTRCTRNLHTWPDDDDARICCAGTHERLSVYAVGALEDLERVTLTDRDGSRSGWRRIPPERNTIGPELLADVYAIVRQNAPAILAALDASDVHDASRIADELRAAFGLGARPDRVRCSTCDGSGYVSDVYAVTCATCHAEPFAPCVDDGRGIGTVHRTRHTAASGARSVSRSSLAFLARTNDEPRAVPCPRCADRAWRASLEADPW